MTDAPLVRRIVDRLQRTIEGREAERRRVDDDISTYYPDADSAARNVPGMLSPAQGLVLYNLTYAQSLRGDVVEIGSWQGRSTCYLARACRDTCNGVVRAVDPFMGTQVTEPYIVEEEDLSDLEANFHRNMATNGLTNHVRAYPMTSQEAMNRHAQDFNNLRLVFIDGDHAHDAVAFDLANFAYRLQPGGIVVLDDYHPDGPGVVRAARELLLESDGFDGFVQFENFLLARRTAAPLAVPEAA